MVIVFWVWVYVWQQNCEVVQTDKMPAIFKKTCCFHLLPVLPQLALIVAQQRDKGGNLSGIRLTALEEGLKKIYAAAKKNKGTVKHLFNKDLSAPLSCCLVFEKSTMLK